LPPEAITPLGIVETLLSDDVIRDGDDCDEMSRLHDFRLSRPSIVGRLANPIPPRTSVT
jgi:hypothetical protein